MMPVEVAILAVAATVVAVVNKRMHEGIVFRPKTPIVRALAAKHGFPVKNIKASTSDPQSLKGMPLIKIKSTEYQKLHQAKDILFHIRSLIENNLIPTMDDPELLKLWEKEDDRTWVIRLDGFDAKVEREFQSFTVSTYGTSLDNLKYNYEGKVYATIISDKHNALNVAGKKTFAQLRQLTKQLQNLAKTPKPTFDPFDL